MPGEPMWVRRSTRRSYDGTHASSSTRFQEPIKARVMVRFSF